MSNGSRRQTWVWLVLFAIGAVDAANAQGRAGCRAPLAPSISVLAGRSEPHLEEAIEISREEPGSSVSVRSGPQLTGRTDLPIAGDLRFRLEAGRSQWDFRRKASDAAAGDTVASDRPIGVMSERHLVAMIGMNTRGFAPCGYLLAGGGLYSLGFRGTSFRGVGPSLATGMEFPVGARGAIQVDATLHLIPRSREARTIISSAPIPTFSFLVGWAHRF